MNNITINIYECYPNISKITNKPYDNYDLCGTVFEVVTDRTFLNFNSVIFGYYFCLDYVKNQNTIKFNFDMLSGDPKTNDYYFSELKNYKDRKSFTIKVDNGQETITFKKKDSFNSTVKNFYNIQDIVLRNLKKIYSLIDKYNIEIEPHQFANTINGFIEHIQSDAKTASFLKEIEHNYLLEYINDPQGIVVENKKTKLKM